jgi:zinc protease
MKNKHAFLLHTLLIILLLLSEICFGAESLTLGPDGYGKMTLANGVTVLVNQDKTTSLSAARIIIGGGILTESVQNNGINNLMIKMLLKGNGAMNASEIGEQLDFLGATVSADCFRDFTAISISCLTENFDKVLNIVSASFQSPTFPEDELAKLKVAVEGQIKSASDNQNQASSNLFWKTAYGDQGYGLRAVGTFETVSRITAADIKTHFDKYAGGRNVVIAIATDLPAEQVARLVENGFGKIEPDAAQVPVPSMVLQPEKTGFIPFDRNQSYVFMGYVFGRLQPEEVACMNILHQLMGAGVGVRLWSLRQTEKLAYEIYTQWIVTAGTSILRAAIGTDTSKVKQALASLEREWNRLAKDGITDQELATAKVNMKNSLIYQIDRKSGRANNMATFEYQGYGYKFILDQIALADGLTIADVNGFIKEKLGADRRYVSVVGKM